MDKRPIILPIVTGCADRLLLGIQDALRERDVIAGKFPIKDYEGQDYRYVALVRDPIDRAISHYFFHRDMGRAHPESDEFVARIGRWIDKGELSFIEYLSITPGALDVYQRMMGYWSPKRFALIGTTDRTDTFLDGLSALIGAPLDRCAPTATETVTLTRAERRDVRRLLQREYDWYEDFTRDQ
jgi:hypothetical protein